MESGTTNQKLEEIVFAMRADMDEGFKDFKEMRTEMREGFREMRNEFGKIYARFDEIHTDIDDLAAFTARQFQEVQKDIAELLDSTTAARVESI